jgi:PII-like signaling protein
LARPSRLHTTKILRLSEDLPVVIEIVDSEDKINSFLPVLDTMTASGLGGLGAIIAEVARLSMTASRPLQN